jgi:hypothetical protein
MKAPSDFVNRWDVMDFDTVRGKLLKLGFGSDEVDCVLDSVSAQVKSFTYANESLEELVVYLVFKNTGGYRLFKTIGGFIVVDKLDSSFSESRELVCLGHWNIKKSYKITFSREQNLIIKETDYKTLHKILFSLVEPTSVKYVLGVEDCNHPAMLTVDCASYKNLGYSELKDCILASYRRSLKQHDVLDILNMNTSCYIVSFSLD